MLHVIPQQPHQVPLIDHGHVVEASPTQGRNHSLRYPVSLRTAKRRQHTSPSAHGSGNEGLPEAGVPVSNKKPRLTAPGCCLDELVPGPVCIRMGGNVEVYQLAPTMLDGEEDVQRAQE